MIGLNGYTVSSGGISKELNGENIIARPLDVDEKMRIGTITQKNMPLSRYGKAYMEALKQHIPHSCYCNQRSYIGEKAYRTEEVASFYLLI